MARYVCKICGSSEYVENDGKKFCKSCLSELSENDLVVDKREETFSDQQQYSFSNSRQTPGNAINQFIMFVREVFAISGSGTVACGSVQNGSISVGDRVNICDALGKKIASDISIDKIECEHKVVENAQVGADVGLLLSVKKDTVPSGCMITTASGDSSGFHGFHQFGNIQVDNSLIERILQEKNKLAAVKLVREETGASLAEAKNVVDMVNIIFELNGNYVTYKKSSPVFTIGTNKMNNENTKKQGCYVATCVYGSYDCPQVWTLRRWRDDTLGASWYGRTFIRAYYKVSPTLVKLFGERRWFRNFFKNKLDKKVAKLNAHGVENTAYEDKNW